MENKNLTIPCANGIYPEKNAVFFLAPQAKKEGGEYTS